MKRIYVLFSAVLGLVLALTECGSSGSSSGTNSLALPASHRAGCATGHGSGSNRT